MKKIYFFLFMFFFIFVLIVFFPFSNKISLYDLLYNSGRVAGLAALFFLAFLVVSGDLARFFDKFFGIDKIIKFQREFSFITLVFVLLHPLFFIIANKKLAIYLIPNFVYLPLAFGIIAFYFFIIVMLCSYFYKRISYYYWQAIHFIIYVMLFLAFFHAFRLGSDVNNIFVKSTYIILFAAFLIGIIYRTFYKIRQFKNKFYLDKIHWETKDTFTIKLKQKNKLNFKPGQFCFLRLNKNKLYARHPFTISSSPNEETLNFTVKLSGRFTKALSELKKDEEIIIEGPFGVFTLDKAMKKENQKKDLVFFAGGVGITPFMSFLKYFYEEENILKIKARKIFLFYGIRTWKDIIANDLFENLLNNKLKNFKLVYCLSQQNKNEIKEKANSKKISFEFGYITENLISQYIQSFENKLYYICGPEPMKKSIVQILKKNKVKNKDIFYESFFW